MNKIFLWASTHCKEIDCMHDMDLLITLHWLHVSYSWGSECKVNIILLRSTCLMQRVTCWYETNQDITSHTSKCFKIFQKMNSSFALTWQFHIVVHIKSIMIVSFLVMGVASRRGIKSHCNKNNHLFLYALKLNPIFYAYPKYVSLYAFAWLYQHVNTLDSQQCDVQHKYFKFKLTSTHYNISWSQFWVGHQTPW